MADDTCLFVISVPCHFACQFWFSGVFYFKEWLMSGPLLHHGQFLLQRVLYSVWHIAGMIIKPLTHCCHYFSSTRHCGIVLKLCTFIAWHYIGHQSQDSRYQFHSGNSLVCKCFWHRQLNITILQGLWNSLVLTENNGINHIGMWAGGSRGYTSTYTLITVVKWIILPLPFVICYTRFQEFSNVDSGSLIISRGTVLTALLCLQTA